MYFYGKTICVTTGVGLGVLTVAVGEFSIADGVVMLTVGLLTIAEGFESYQSTF